MINGLGVEEIRLVDKYMEALKKHVVLYLYIKRIKL